MMYLVLAYIFYNWKSFQTLDIGICFYTYIVALC